MGGDEGDLYDEQARPLHGIPDLGATDDDDIVIPFVATVPYGGTYDLASFEAGYLVAQIEHALSNDVVRYQAPIRAALIRQVDVLAMRYGYRLETRPLNPTSDPDSSQEWVVADLVFIPPEYDPQTLT